MKVSIKLLTLILLGTSLLFTSCRKGEDDPFLSFRSRNARLSGKWELVESSKRYEQREDLKIIATTFKLNGGTMEVIQSQLGRPNLIGEFDYSERIEFDKDGTYDHEIKEEGERYINRGNWMWIHENEQEDVGDMEAIVLTITESNEGYTYSGKTNPPQSIWVFKRLSNKNLVVEIDQQYYDKNGDGYSLVASYEYTQD